MGIMVSKNGQDFVNAPEGLHAAVCVDVIDKGEMLTKWGKKHKVKIVWEIEALMDNGQRFTATQLYSATLDDKSNLRKDLRSWRGKDFTPDELAGDWDLEQVIGKSCQVFIEHATTERGTFANVTKVLKPVKKLEPSGKYTRVTLRPDNNKPSTAQQAANAEVEVEIPF